MMRINGNLLYIFFLLGVLVTLYEDVCGQTHLIYYGDTLAQQKYMGRFENHLQQPYYGKPFYDFKEKLPDGTYIYLDARRKDSLNMDFDKSVLIQGQYVDSLRTGRFEYYASCETTENDRKTEQVLVHVYNYKEGLLDGEYMSRNCKYKLYEGYYEMGKRHGFFFTYNATGDLIEVELYQDDTLLYKSKFPDITIAKFGKDTLEPKYLKPE